MNLDKLVNVQIGKISLSNGKHEFFVCTRETPSQILISKCHTEPGSNCINDDLRDWFDFEIEDGGFMFYSKINSESVQLDWVSLFS